MAEIPVERKTGGGLPWWLIPLLLALLLIPLFFLLRGCNNTPVATNANTNANRVVATNANASANTGTAATNANMMTGANTATTGAAITDVGTYGTTTDKNSLVGRQVNLDNVKVTRVLSDKVFTVGTGAGETYALLSDALDSPGGKEKQIKMQPGQTVDIAGEFRRVPTAETSEETKNNKEGALNSKEYAEMKGAQIYLHTTKVEDSK